MQSLYHERREGSAAQAAFTCQAVDCGYNPWETGRSGEAASDCTNVQSLYHERREGSAAQATFTCQAVDCGYNPWETGRSGEAASDCTNVQSLYHTQGGKRSKTSLSEERPGTLTSARAKVILEEEE